MRISALLLVGVLAVGSSVVGCAAAGESVGSDSANLTADPRIHASAGYKQAGAEDRAKIDQIASGSYEVQQGLADILEGDASRLYDTDKDAVSTLDNLVALATQPMHAKIAALGDDGFNGEKIRAAVLADIAHPDDIHQGHFNTCEITNLQYGLATAYPAEYVRLMRGLVGTAGKVTMKKGDDLHLFTSYLVPKDNDDRSASEAIFQTSVMDHITGSYDPQKDRSKLLFVSYPGNSTHMAKGTFEQLYGVKYDVEGQSDLEVVLNPLSTMDKGEAKRFLESLSTQRAPTMVDASLKDIDVSHSLFVIKVENGRVFFRNPWGPNDIASNSGQVEDASRSIYSMTIDELAGYTQIYVAPHESN